MRLILIPEARGRGSLLYCEFDGLALELRPQDLSQAGVFVITTTPPALDRELELFLMSPIGEIAVRGQVVQVISGERACLERRQPGFGVLFVDLADDQRAFIGLSLDAAVRAAADSTPARAPRAPLGDAQIDEQRKLAGRRQQMYEQLERELMELQTKAPWAVLGLQPSPAAEDVRQAYLAFSRRYHPHVYAHLDSPEVSRLATELFIAHKRAYTTLCSLRPTAADQSASEPPVVVKLPPSPRAPAVSLRAPVAVVDAAVAARVSANPTPPAPLANGAASLKPARVARENGTSTSRPARSTSASGSAPAGKRRTADAEIALSAGLKHLAASRFDEAAEELERALALCPTLRDATIWLHVCRARKHRAGGRGEQAAQEYRALLELDPEHREALEQTGRSPRRRAGLIGKLFGTENE